MHTHAHTYTRMHTHAHTCINAHTHTHAHTCYLKAPVLDAAFSPSGEFFASGGADEQVCAAKA